MSKERELLEKLFPYLGYSGATGSLIKEVEELLAEPEAEPVAFILKGHTMTGDIADYLSWTKLGMGVVNKIDGYEPEPLYTHPPRQPVRLRDDEIIRIFSRTAWEVLPINTTDELIECARAVIAAYEEKQK